MNSFYPQRLHHARLLAGLSVRDLADQVGKSHNTIHLIEKGELSPDPALTLALAKALKQTPGYFFQPLTVSISKIEFRKKASLGSRQVDRIRVEVTNHLERYLEVENILGIATEVNWPIAPLISEDKDVEVAAIELRHAWELGSSALPNVLEMLEDREVKVLELEAEPAFDGLAAHVAPNMPIMVVNAGFTIERKRFTALHELGHLLLQFPEDLPEKEKETYCHRFAGAMLLPAEKLHDALGDNRSQVDMEEFIALKEFYGISIQALVMRAFHLGLITRPAYQQFWKTISKNKAEEGLGAYQGKEHSGRFRQLVHRALAQGLIAEVKAAHLLGLGLEAFRGTEAEQSGSISTEQSSFAKAWDDDEPEYFLNDLQSLNPDYEPR